MTSRASAVAIRETLDEAVHHLSVSADPIQDRVRTSGRVILDCLSRTDFTSSEDRELFDQIQAALTDAHLKSAVADQMSDAAAEKVASDILDLRDTTTGRAIRNACTTTRARAWRRSRR